MAATSNRAAASPDPLTLLKKSGKIEPMLIDALTENPWQPRLSIAPNELEDLKKSIVDFGFIGYIPVRRADPDDPASPLEIVFGHRRVMAARLLGMQTVPVMLCDLDDAGMMRLAFVENSTQKKMTYWEEALHFKEMRDQLGLSVRKLADMLGLSRNYVHSRLTLLNLPPGSPLRIAAERNDIAMANALVFANLARTLDAAHLETLLDDVRRGDISLDDLQALDRALAKSYEIADGALDEEGNIVRTSTIEDQKHLQAELVEQTRRKELRGGGEVSGSRALREAAALEERRSRQDTAAAPETAPGDATGAIGQPAGKAHVVEPDQPGTPPGGVRADHAAFAPKDGLAYAREALEQLRGVLTHLRPRAEKADFSRLDPEERQELKVLRAELARLLADA